MDSKKIIDQAQRRYPHDSGAASPTAQQAAGQFMLLPAANPADTRLIRIPDDFESHEAYRAITGLIAEVEDQDADYDWEDIEVMLEERGFETVEFLIGPSLD